MTLQGTYLHYRLELNLWKKIRLNAACGSHDICLWSLSESDTLYQYFLFNSARIVLYSWFLKLVETGVEALSDPLISNFTCTKCQANTLTQPRPILVKAVKTN